MAGIDPGIANFLADSNGEFVPNPRHGPRAADKLGAAQQALSRFPRGKAKDRTANHQRAVEKVAQLHGKVRRPWLDHAHKASILWGRGCCCGISLTLMQLRDVAAESMHHDTCGASARSGGSLSVPSRR
ncbi:transposase [Streptomyces sp. NPDC055140]